MDRCPRDTLSLGFTLFCLFRFDNPPYQILAFLSPARSHPSLFSPILARAHLILYAHYSKSAGNLIGLATDILYIPLLIPHYSKFLSYLTFLPYSVRHKSATTLPGSLGNASSPTAGTVLCYAKDERMGRTCRCVVLWLPRCVEP